MSLERTARILGAHPLIAVAPAGLDTEPLLARYAGIRVERFPKRYFRSLRGYNNMMLSDEFYRRFASYEYILLCQLDAFPIRDELAEWCRKGWDYVGAPWFADFERGGSDAFIGAGNGGFSLRRVDAFRAVLAAGTLHADPERWATLGRDFRLRSTRLVPILIGASRVLPRVPWARLFRMCFSGNEDLFWSAYAPFMLPGFRTAPVDEALRFAFDCQPRLCWERAGRRLPFGCHAWFKYDPAFWLAVLEGREPPALQGLRDGSRCN